MSQARTNLVKKGKLRLTLVPVEVIIEISKVLEFGIVKHKKQDSWKKMVINNKRDFYDAALRHLYASLLGEQYDNESRLSHIAHAITNLVFILWLELKNKTIKKVLS